MTDWNHWSGWEDGTAAALPRLRRLSAVDSSLRSSPTPMGRLWRPNRPAGLSRLGANRTHCTPR